MNIFVQHVEEKNGEKIMLAIPFFLKATKKIKLQ